MPLTIAPNPQPSPHPQVMRFRPLSWRNTHAAILADRMEDLTPPEDLLASAHCDRTVSLYGYVRGSYLKPRSTVHLAGVGDFELRAGARRVSKGWGWEGCAEPRGMRPPRRPCLTAPLSAHRSPPSAPPSPPLPSAADVLPDPCPPPAATATSAKRTLRGAEKRIYAPLGDLGDLVYDHDAVYINLPDSVGFLLSPPSFFFVFCFSFFWFWFFGCALYCALRPLLSSPLSSLHARLTPAPNRPLQPCLPCL